MKKENRTVYFTTGEIKSKTQYDIYNKTGNTMSYGLHGTYESFYINGQAESIINYYNGRIHGLCVWFNTHSINEVIYYINENN